MEIQKLEYLKNEKIFLDETKMHFLQFLKGYHLKKENATNLFEYFILFLRI